MANASFTIDIGEKYIKVADVEKKGEQLIPLSLAFDQNPANIYLSESIKDTQATSSLIQKLVKDAGVKKKNVKLVIPDSQSYAQILEMPAITEKELLSAIRYQADQFIPIPIEKVNLDIEIINEDKKNKKLLILLVAAPIALLNKMSGLIEESNLIADSIQTELSASLGLIDMMFKKNTECTLFINFGYTTSTLYLFCPNIEVGTSIPLQIRNFPLGLDLFLRDMKSNLNISDKDALNILETNGFLPNGSMDISKIVESPYNEFIAQIQKFLQSIKSTNELSIKKIYMFGEGYKIKGIETKISPSIGIPTEILNPYNLFVKNNVSDFFKNDLPYFIPSIGSNI